MAEIRKAAERDVLPVAAIYEHIISEEEAGRVCIGWQRGVYPTEHTAREAIAAGELFVMADGGEIVAAARINRTQVPEYADAQWEYAAPDDKIMVLHARAGDMARSLCTSMSAMRSKTAARICAWIRTRRTRPRGGCMRASAIKRSASWTAHSTA